jgi:hypothetical protein
MQWMSGLEAQLHIAKERGEGLVDIAGMYLARSAAKLTAELKKPDRSEEEVARLIAEVDGKIADVRKADEEATRMKHMEIELRRRS